MTQVKQEDTRCRILATAELLFRQIGFQKTTVADIARQLCMSPANVYRFFASKAEIHEAVGRSLMEEVEEGASAIAHGPGTSAERIGGMIKSIETMSRERYAVDFKLHEMVEVALSENWPSIKEHVTRIVGMLAGLVAEGVQSGEFPKQDPLKTALLIHTAVMRFCHPRMLVECADFPGPNTDEMIDFCLRAIKSAS